LSYHDVVNKTTTTTVAAASGKEFPTKRERGGRQAEYEFIGKEEK
jgi:hypothetical protein